MGKVYERGQIYYVSSSVNVAPVGAEIWSDRPALIVSNDVTNKQSGAVEVVYLTTSTKRQPSPLLIRVNSGSRPALANCSQIHSVDKSRLKQLMGRVTIAEMNEIDKALCFSLGIDATNYRSLFKKWENYIREYNIEVKEELECIRETTFDKVVRNLISQINVLSKERDTYRSLAETKQALLNGIERKNIL